jgi:hypothetical protein
MDWNNPRSVEANIKRLQREIAEIDNDLYGFHEKSDRMLYANSLEHKRDDIVRGAVLQLHTSIEDLLNFQMMRRMLSARNHPRARKGRSQPAAALHRLLSGQGSIGFDMKLNLAIGLGIINAPARAKLMELNTLRNKCSHNWKLNVKMRRGKRPRQMKPPLLQFRGRDLHKGSVLKDFTGEYDGLYATIWVRFGET